MRRISPAEIELGMQVRGFEGSWLSHPFFRSNFEVKTERQLKKIRNSSVDAVLIEDALNGAAGGGEQIRIGGHTITLPDEILVGKEGIGFPGEQKRARELLDKSKKQIMATFADLRMGKMVRTEELSPLVDEISDVIVSSRGTFHNVLSLKSRDEYTYLHSVAVCAMMIKFSRKLGIREQEIPEFGLAGLLHDVGKAFIPEEILNKSGRLTDEEFKLVKEHPARGHAELTKAPDMPKVVLDVCLHHHERMSGEGYPEALPAKKLSKAARMAAICDVYDALTSDRAYKDAWSSQKALREMASWEGHFDPQLLVMFQEVLGIYPVGAHLRLKSGEIALVVGESANPMIHGVYIMGKELNNIEGRPVVKNVRSVDIVGLA
ncbi:HD-GYP domain-containing protein [Pacificimonas sp. WHA3]|uniref:HD-GYP domain-containing protein n=2 Tax=Pacificimonas pallii TaxID=2827236 RepID=A0ABS6SHN8_9SPHN|nr:HD-GYP domain-containing protein [Pacificimonas pallii]MBV7257932.1 HD-GYP domain-containing protein [Pacificimonas pallii]